MLIVIYKAHIYFIEIKFFVDPLNFCITLLLCQHKIQPNHPQQGTDSKNSSLLCSCSMCEQTAIPLNLHIVTY